MAKRHKAALWIVALLALALGACAGAGGNVPARGQQPTPGATAAADAGYREIDVPGLAAMLQHKDFQLVNVHVPYAGEIADTDAFVPYDKITGSLTRFPTDKNARIVLYCRSGMMSDIAAKTLAQAGYADVWSLKGGMIAWQLAGNTLLQQPRAEATAMGQPTVDPAAGTLAATKTGGTLPAEARTSEGGGVIVEVTPAVKSGEDLVFTVAMNTHSVDLSYDYRALATLRDDQGHTYAAAAWDGGSGGHHVSGKLIFRNSSPVPGPGVRWVELDLAGIAGVSQRTFRWDIGSGESS